jgi:hypothetical protein
MSAIADVVRPRRISPPTRVGSVVAQPLQPHGAPGEPRDRAHADGASCDNMFLHGQPARPMLDPPARKATVARSASATRAGSARPLVLPR